MDNRQGINELIMKKNLDPSEFNWVYSDFIRN